jgi:hypothetical protein
MGFQCQCIVLDNDACLEQCSLGFWNDLLDVNAGLDIKKLCLFGRNVLLNDSNLIEKIRCLRKKFIFEA